MEKKKTVRTYQRRTKSGKVVTVRQHTAKYDAAEEVRKALSKKKGAGDELISRKKVQKVQEELEDTPFTAEEFAEWYEGTGSKADKKVEKALRKQLGRKAYNELNDEVADNYKKGGYKKYFKSVSKDWTIPASKKITSKETKGTSKVEIPVEKKSAKSSEGISAKGKITEKTSSGTNDLGVKIPGSWKKTDDGFSFSGTSSWGHPRHTNLEKFMDKLQAAGWKKASSDSMSPDDKNFQRVTILRSPDSKYEFRYVYKDGDYGPNKHNATIRRVEPQNKGDVKPTSISKPVSRGTATTKKRTDTVKNRVNPYMKMSNKELSDVATRYIQRFPSRSEQKAFDEALSSRGLTARLVNRDTAVKVGKFKPLKKIPNKI